MDKDFCTVPYRYPDLTSNPYELLLCSFSTALVYLFIVIDFKMFFQIIMDVPACLCTSTDVCISQMEAPGGFCCVCDRCDHILFYSAERCYHYTKTEVKLNLRERYSMLLMHFSNF